VASWSETSEAPVIFFTGAFLLMNAFGHCVIASHILQSNDIDIYDEPLYISVMKDRNFIEY
jgi:hypothetical protein